MSLGYILQLSQHTVQQKLCSFIIHFNYLAGAYQYALVYQTERLKSSLYICFFSLTQMYFKKIKTSCSNISVQLWMMFQKKIGKRLREIFSVWSDKSKSSIQKYLEVFQHIKNVLRALKERNWNTLVLFVSKFWQWPQLFTWGTWVNLI